MLGVSPAQALDLVSSAEAALPDDVTRGITRSASIVQEQPPPKSGPVRSPFQLKIALKAHGGSRIDVKSVQLIYMKTPMVDLTERVRAGISESGILMEGLSLPPGQHRIQVRVADSEGRESEAMVQLDVAR
ncbi:hypothetical protein [Roseateles oligotrophus]|uniref:Uncharacterized protein n=1 Tax=Roseateles oligotrophus TaxID=1769250 RepID=A0ABT2YB42_9BURK|nr:hypothetical protein [Roseateles oligotrophus]MCV2367527.1 hypothetical protein [Roseateles oligotrophus]